MPTVARRLGGGQFRLPTPDDRDPPVKRPRLKGPLDQLTEREREVLALIAEGRSDHGVSQLL